METVEEFKYNQPKREYSIEESADRIKEMFPEAEYVIYAPPNQYNCVDSYLLFKNHYPLKGETWLDTVRIPGQKSSETTMPSLCVPLLINNHLPAVSYKSIMYHGSNIKYSLEENG